LKTQLSALTDVVIASLGVVGHLTALIYVGTAPGRSGHINAGFANLKPA